MSRYPLIDARDYAGTGADPNNLQLDPDKILGRALRATGGVGLALAEVW